MADRLSALNFKSVQRTDPHISEIILTSSHAVLYVFESEKWERAEIEGTMIFYRRKVVEEPWAYVILNRLHANNFQQICTPNSMADVQLEDGLLMYRSHPKGTVFGLWIYDEGEREQFFQILKDALEPEANPMVAVCLPAPTAANKHREPSGADLRTLLDEAMNKKHASSSGGGVLQTLFESAASHQSSPEKLPRRKVRHQNSNEAKQQHRKIDAGKLVKCVMYQYGSDLHLSQFKRATLECLQEDDTLWEDLYGLYIEQRLQS